ncbi:ExeA family protein [Sphingosinicella sp. CPCC 101087]|uniref:ExeA family protein n=1 Tax=Sphingosinicella sp. CPCC 101087 TaxID=2497754 RepID=UPI00101BD500|nr:AAA family ATPase [Sphingosinicella sp. CPCC 101087]
MYIEHYGLAGQPFQLTPDARFWFESRTHRKAMAYLGYGLAQGEGFIVVTGEIGAGKSTLVAHLMATIDRARLNAISLVSTQVEGDDMLRLAAQGLGLATAGVEKARLLDAVEQRLEQELRSGKRTLLIVDEAQNLPVSALEELRMLSNFQIAGKALIQIVLLGQPEFRDKLASPGLEQLRQRVIATHHLYAMGEDEVEAYIRHRLGLVAWQGRPDFAPGALAAVHAATGGIPRRVNQLANRLLLHAAVEDADMIVAEAVEAVAADMNADTPAPAPAPAAPPQAEEERVLPIRAARSSPAEPANEPASPSQAVPFADPALLRRIAALEARAEEQEKMLRRVLTLLVDWVENGSPETAYRTHAA